jgi:hypothetical protein
MNSNEVDKIIASSSKTHQRILAASCLSHIQALIDIIVDPSDLNLLKSVEECAWRELENPQFDLYNLTNLILENKVFDCDDDSGLEGYQLYLYHVVCKMASSIYNNSIEDLKDANRTLRTLLSGFDSKTKDTPHLDFKNPERLNFVESEVHEQLSILSCLQILPVQYGLPCSVMREKAAVFSRILHKSILGNENVLFKLKAENYPGVRI